jgi:hypothetical protein
MGNILCCSNNEQFDILPVMEEKPIECNPFTRQNSKPFSDMETVIVILFL